MGKARKTKSDAAAAIRDRIVEFTRVKASTLVPNASNWRTHPASQRAALRGILASVGYVDALLARKLPDGRLELIDGHLRAEETPDTEVPVLVVDLDDDEAARVLATFDPLSAMAEADAEKFAELLAGVKSDDASLAELMKDLNVPVPQQTETVLKQLDTKQPPKMSWCLIGIPTVRFGEVAAAIEHLAGIDGVICETTANDG